MKTPDLKTKQQEARDSAKALGIAMTAILLGIILTLTLVLIAL